MEYLIITLLLVNLLVLVVLNRSQKQKQKQEVQTGFQGLESLLKSLQEGKAHGERELRVELIHYLSGHQKQNLEALHQMQVKLIADSAIHQQKLAAVLQESLDRLMNSNETKLASIEQKINEKLDRSLNERLDSSFKTIGKQLSDLYVSLGEVARLTNGVQDLNRTLSNVKTRGIWGEIQLERILENILTPAQYDKNVAIKRNAQERVEFAVKIPDKERPSEFLYLPIDSKMPMDIYQKIADASEAGDGAALKLAVKELEYRIKAEARTIRDKYISPPQTTDFAILFLPTENLFAEVLRIGGLAEWCQQECKIVIAGPTTIAALLNSLQIGFRYLTVNKNSQDVLHLLAAIKAQYAKLNDLIDKTQKKLDEAKKTTEDLKSRNDQIHKRLLKIDEIDFEESNLLLGLKDTDY